MSKNPSTKKAAKRAAKPSPTQKVVPDPSDKTEKPPEPVPMGSITMAHDVLKLVTGAFSNVVNRKTVFPMFHHILAVSDHGRVYLRATDNTVFATCTLAEPVIATSGLAKALQAARHARENGIFLIPFDELKTIASTADREPVSFQAFRIGKEEFNIRAIYTIAGVVVERTFKTMPPDDFPQSEAEVPMDAAIDIYPDTHEAIIQALSVSSEDETRYVLNGVAFDGQTSGDHCIVATDGRRLFTRKVDDFPFQEKTFILPKHLCITKGPFQASGWKIAFTEVGEEKHPFARLVLGRWDYTIRLIEGNYPNWRQVMPDDDILKINVDLSPAGRELLLATVPKIPLAHKLEYVSLTLSDRVVCHVGNTAIPLPTSDVLWEGKKASDFNIKFNRCFFLEALKQGFEAMYLSDERSPAVFRRGATTHVLMPMRIEE